MRLDPIAALVPWRRHAEAIARARALQALPVRHRAALLLHDEYGFTTAEVAQILDCSPVAIDTILTQARASLAATQRHPR